MRSNPVPLRQHIRPWRDLETQSFPKSRYGSASLPPKAGHCKRDVSRSESARRFGKLNGNLIPYRSGRKNLRNAFTLPNRSGCQDSPNVPRVGRPDVGLSVEGCQITTPARGNLQLLLRGADLQRIGRIEIPTKGGDVSRRGRRAGFHGTSGNRRMDAAQGVPASEFTSFSSAVTITPPSCAARARYGQSYTVRPVRSARSNAGVTSGRVA